MQFLKFGLVPLLAALPGALACNGYTGGVPKATGTVTSKSYIEIKAGQVYDGKWQRFDRGSGACGGQSEGDYKDSVFYIQAGGTLKNAIIGKNQAEGVHCNGHCTLEFVWFEDVCEDAISIKNDKAGTQTWIVGGGAYHASDKVIQHNGCGTVNVVSIDQLQFAQCKTQCKRNLAGINLTYKDTATLKNVCADAKTKCQMYNGCAGGCEPSKAGTCSG
ncbi:pectate lyase C [Colletotrichum scovillei]|uniref:pectate lyase C n=1 Tax=Colletotrichum scovillei TaxID=1209932 RepID=UPI0015C3C01C|nr:pectate lyase C [Colletotrichum scovillei]KAF4778209.1 pectate lyase C [Colletotrichum scovillei]